MFDKILIANRGEIACRVARTAKRLGIRTVAVFSEADANALHVAGCDEAYLIGPAHPRESYLRADRILEAAKKSGAQAIHPGYGFLSENAEFVKACGQAGVAFIGPPAEVIESMGSKSTAKALMEKAGVPLVPGYHGVDQDAGMLKKEADRIGYPVLIKASAGGGGKGMRVVGKAADFADALAAAKREAASSFGDDRVLIEKYLTRSRHIEVQVFADTQKHCVYLFERDCSVQRRHQKILEEAPAPGMTAERRAKMGAAAVAAAKAVGYVGAGTVEFIAEQDERFYFMEMNTRLQVEHPVTEAITGQDLVEWQLRVAAGEPLPLRQEQLHLHGHAIEARLCAENPDANFLPATGRLDVLRWPDEHVAFRRDGLVRVDAGVREGDAISPFYDSMIAKLIVWGETREQALARLDDALARTHIVGPHTNVAFLRRVVNSASFARADLDTALIERERVVLFNQAGLPPEVAAAGVVAHALAVERILEDVDPWSRRDGWRLHGGARRRFDLEFGGMHHAVNLDRAHDGALTLVISGRQWPLLLHASIGDHHDILIGQRRWALTVFASGERASVFAREGSATVLEVDVIANAGEGVSEGGRLTAPMPGRVVAFLALPGQAVKHGQPLAVLEAMKMEHTITSPRDGTIAELLYAVGDQVAEGGELLRLSDE